MESAIWPYAIYAFCSIGLTVGLARTLFRNGQVFLAELFPNDAKIAQAINSLLVTGFFMLNLGYALLIFKTVDSNTALQATENLVTKLGLLLVSLGVIHFINMAVFWKIKRGGERDKYIPAVPSTFVPPPPMANAR